LPKCVQGTNIRITSTGTCTECNKHAWKNLQGCDFQNGTKEKCHINVTPKNQGADLVEKLRFTIIVLKCLIF